MNINVNFESVAKRRAIIALTIIPFTFIVAYKSAVLGVRAMWRDAAAAWRAAN